MDPSLKVLSQKARLFNCSGRPLGPLLAPGRAKLFGQAAVATVEHTAVVQHDVRQVCVDPRGVGDVGARETQGRIFYKIFWKYLCRFSGLEF